MAAATSCSSLLLLLLASLSAFFFFHATVVHTLAAAAAGGASRIDATTATTTTDGGDADAKVYIVFTERLPAAAEPSSSEQDTGVAVASYHHDRLGTVLGLFACLNSGGI